VGLSRIFFITETRVAGRRAPENWRSVPKASEYNFGETDLTGPCYE
jgi:hypothetical protein